MQNERTDQRRSECRVQRAQNAEPVASGSSGTGALPFLGCLRWGYVPDPVFADPGLARIYDPLDLDRSDLDAYLAMVKEFDAALLLDLGCGTGTFACRLANRGIDVVAVDLAAVSLDVARTKPGVKKVRWLHGDRTLCPRCR